MDAISTDWMNVNNQIMYEIWKFVKCNMKLIKKIKYEFFCCPYFCVNIVLKPITKLKFTVFYYFFSNKLRCDINLKLFIHQSLFCTGIYSKIYEEKLFVPIHILFNSNFSFIIVYNTIINYYRQGSFIHGSFI